MNFQATHKQRKLIVAASIAGLVGIFLPWQSFSVSLFGSGMSHGVNGFHGAGILAFLSLLATVALSLIGQLTDPLDKNKWLGVLAAGAIAVLCAITNMINTKTGSAGFIGMDIGIGCWITLVAAIGIIVVAWMFRKPGQNLAESLTALKKNMSVISAAPGVKGDPVQQKEQSKIEELEKLIKLKEAGHLSEEEYTFMKGKLLSGNAPEVHN